MSSIQQLNLEEEDIVIGKSSSAADSKFDAVIGTIEDVIMEPKFQIMQDEFMNKNYKHFEDTEENKLIYTTIHKEYVSQVEKYLETSLKKRIDHFSMEEFMKDLMSRRDELDGEIFEILLTFGDFLEFKQLMLSFKAEKEGKSLDLGLCVQSFSCDENGQPSSRAVNQHASLSISGSNNNSRSNNGNKKNTPLLDRAQVDSDNE